MAIDYPQFLKNKLDGDKRLHGAVLGTEHLFDSWLKDSRLPFFPDYTDHGPDHLSNVLPP